MVADQSPAEAEIITVAVGIDGTEDDEVLTTAPIEPIEGAGIPSEEVLTDGLTSEELDEVDDVLYKAIASSLWEQLVQLMDKDDETATVLDEAKFQEQIIAFLKRLAAVGYYVVQNKLLHELV